MNLDSRWEAIIGRKMDPRVANTAGEIFYTYDAATDSRRGLNFGVIVVSKGLFTLR